LAALFLTEGQRPCQSWQAEKVQCAGIENASNREKILTSLFCKEEATVKILPTQNGSGGRGVERKKTIGRQANVLTKLDKRNHRIVEKRKKRFLSREDCRKARGRPFGKNGNK